MSQRQLTFVLVGLVAAMAAGFALTLLVPWLRTFLGFQLPGVELLGATLAIAGAAVAAMLAGVHLARGRPRRGGTP